MTTPRTAPWSVASQLRAVAHRGVDGGTRGSSRRTRRESRRDQDGDALRGSTIAASQRGRDTRPQVHGISTRASLTEAAERRPADGEASVPNHSPPSQLGPPEGAGLSDLASDLIDRRMSGKRSSSRSRPTTRLARCYVCGGGKAGSSWPRPTDHHQIPHSKRRVSTISSRAARRAGTSDASADTTTVRTRSGATSPNGNWYEMLDAIVSR